jgi:endonuclease YncB( thermonuclease family)
MVVGELGQDGRRTVLIDGDTVAILTPDNQQVRVRVNWIDAPELGQPFGHTAKQAMSGLVFGKEVELSTRGKDRYGRTLALVFVDGVDAGLELIRLGMAWPYYKYLPEADQELRVAYLAAAERAKANRLGLWSDPDPMPPWQCSSPGS